MDPCGCNEKAQAIGDEAISTRTMFDNINDLKANKVSLKQIRTLAKKYEELNKYFSPEVFAAGITQRADFIKANGFDKVEALKAHIHPAMYKAKVVNK